MKHQYLELEPAHRAQKANCCDCNWIDVIHTCFSRVVYPGDTPLRPPSAIKMTIKTQEGRNTRSLQYLDKAPLMTKPFHRSQVAPIEARYNMTRLQTDAPVHAFAPRYMGTCPLGHQEVIIFTSY